MKKADYKDRKNQLKKKHLTKKNLNGKITKQYS